MPKGAEKPVVKNPTISTLEAYKNRHVEIIKDDGEVFAGRLAMVTTEAVVLHVRHEQGHHVPAGIFVAEIESVQELKRK